MDIVEPRAIDFKNFSLSKIGQPQYRHFLLLLFWPIYSVVFILLERFFVPASFHTIYSKIDDLIPFNEIFVIPYVFWYIFLAAMHVYTMLFNVKAFKKMMYFIISTFAISVLIWIVFPNCQELRPTEFARDNILTDIMKGLYIADTNTNVFPSLHVVGSCAVVFAAWDLEEFPSFAFKIGIALMGVLISISTVFLKQHSIIDVIGGLILSVIMYIIIYGIIGKKERKDG